MSVYATVSLWQSSWYNFACHGWKSKGVWQLREDRLLFSVLLG